MDSQAWLVGPALAILALGACSLSVSFDDLQGGESTPAAGGGGAGGGVDEGCATAQDCPSPDQTCISALCLNGVCGTIPTPNGSQAGDQTAEDCLEVICDGDGAEILRNTDADRPTSTECRKFSCTEGILGTDDADYGTSCQRGDGSAGVCDGEGQCNQCNAPSDCAGIIAESFCTTAACDNGLCVGRFTQSGEPHPVQTPGDCKEWVCDGMGTLIEVNADKDVFDDNNECTVNTCNGGNPEISNEGDGTTCGLQDTLSCVNGVCDGCTQANQCGNDDECIQHQCTPQGSCTFVATSSGTEVTAQTSGDCLKTVCNGQGTTRDDPFDTDTPDDGIECTLDQCDNGAALHPPAPVDTSCNGDTEYCDGNNNCVACNSPGQCPAAPTCSAATCDLNVCGTETLPDGTPTGNQVGGDCRTEVCVSGAVDYEDANGDLPDDGDDCTLDLCSSGAPSHPDSPAGTACDQSGGQVCDGAGVCSDCVSQNHAYCAAAEYCATTNDCVADLGNGNVCSSTAQCTSGNCVNSRCCAQSSCGTCRDCTSGSCAPVRDNTDPYNHCQGAQVCFSGVCCLPGGESQPQNYTPGAEALPCPKEQLP